MANFFNSFLQQLGTGDQIKDYQHAARLFIDGVYRLAPKYQSLYHVFIDVNTAVANLSRENQIEVGMLAKSITLPKFNVQKKILNAYNRKNIVQERVSYDPVTLTFHDDSADVVRQFWYGYFSYYYRDSDHQLSVYSQDHKYRQRQEQDWGFTPQNAKSINYISSIRIYSLHQKSFTSYILINPTISDFQHGTHTAGEFAPMEHSMTIDYEAVQYEAGPVNNNTVLGFSEIHYDNSPSPLSAIGGGTRSILGPGGLVQGAGDVITNLQNGNFVGAALGGLRTATTFKNGDFRSVISAEANQTFRNILRAGGSGTNRFFPTSGDLIGGLARAINSIPGRFNSQTILPNSNQGIADRNS